MHTTVAMAAVKRKVFDAVSPLKREADVPAGEAAPAAAAKTPPATADAGFNAPIATATVIVKMAVGLVRIRTLSITPDSLAFYDINMDYVVEPGDFEVMVGNSSRDEDLQKVLLTVK